MLIFREIDSTLLACIEIVVNTADTKSRLVSALFCCIAFFAVSASDLQADSGEEGAWGGGAIDVAGIAVHALV